MRIEIYYDGKQLKDIGEGQATIQPEYYGIDTSDGHHWTEKNIMIGLGTKGYWNCIVKFKDKNEAKDFVKQLKRCI